MRARTAALCAVTMLSGSTLLSQTPAAVHTFVPGSGQSSGQEPQHFPANVLGLPDPSGRRTVPTIDPRQIASLGMGGEIVLRFDAPIVDGPGPDLTVFENAFYYTIGPRERLYAEPAEVSVSRDGITYTAWPFDSLTLDGCAGTAPTQGDADPFDPRVSGGNSFDLARLGIDSVRYVRIRDVTAIVASNPSHPFWDPTLSGFDLDAVVAIPLESRGTAAVDPVASLPSTTFPLAPNPASSVVVVTLPDEARVLRIVDAVGRLQRQERLAPGSERCVIDLAGLAAGIYVVEITGAGAGTSAMLHVRR